MQSESNLLGILSQVGTIWFLISPMLLISLVGGVVAIVKWRQGSRAALLVLLGCGWYLIVGLGMPFLYAIVPKILIQARGGAGISMLYYGLNLLWTICDTIAYGLLVWAVYAGRATASPLTPPPLIPQNFTRP